MILVVIVILTKSRSHSTSSNVCCSIFWCIFGANPWTASNLGKANQTRHLCHIPGGHVGASHIYKSRRLSRHRFYWCFVTNLDDFCSFRGRKGDVFLHWTLLFSGGKVGKSIEKKQTSHVQNMILVIQTCNFFTHIIHLAPMLAPQLFSPKTFFCHFRRISCACGVVGLVRSTRWNQEKGRFVFDLSGFVRIRITNYTYHLKIQCHIYHIFNLMDILDTM